MGKGAWELFASPFQVFLENEKLSKQICEICENSNNQKPSLPCCLDNTDVLSQNTPESVCNVKCAWQVCQRDTLNLAEIALLPLLPLLWHSAPCPGQKAAGVLDFSPFLLPLAHSRHGRSFLVHMAGGSIPSPVWPGHLQACCFSPVCWLHACSRLTSDGSMVHTVLS